MIDDRVIDTVALVRLEAGKVLSARSRGKDRFYLPGGKREPGESDLETLVREIAEELNVAIRPASARHYGTFEGPAHGHAVGVTARIACYTAEYDGSPLSSNEIAEIDWFGYTERPRMAPVPQLIFDHLRAAGLLLD